MKLIPSTNSWGIKFEKIDDSSTESMTDIICGVVERLSKVTCSFSSNKGFITTDFVKFLLIVPTYFKRKINDYLFVANEKHHRFYFLRCYT